MNFSSLFGTAIAMNNKGVRFLNDGNRSAALQEFQHAVLHLRQASDVLESRWWPNVGLMPRAFPAQSSALGANDSPKNAAITTRIQAATPPSKLVGLQTEQCYVYDRPILLPTGQPEDGAIVSVEDFDAVVLTTSTSIMFNMALACHQHGQLTGSAEALTKAATLYEFIVKVWSATAAAADSSAAVHDVHPEPPHILQCLALNNLAQLHYSRCDYATCLVYLDRLLDIVVSFPRSLGGHCHNSSHLLLREEDVAQILLNLVHMNPPSGACAA